MPTVQPVDVPLSVKSEAVKPVTEPENERLYDRLATFVGVVVVGANEATVGVLRSTVTVVAAVTAAGPALAAASTTAFWASVRITVPSGASAPAIVTVYVVPEPVIAATPQPTDVPPSENLPAVRPVTGSLKVAVYATLASLVSVAAGVSVTVGTVRSTVTAVAVSVAFGLAAASAKVPPVIDSSTVPALVEAPETVTVYGPTPEPVRLVTLQPVAVPPMAKLLVVRPVTASLSVSE